MERVVVARELGKRYGDTTALRSLTLSIEAGEIFTLIGPNGAGKTTFVRIATGTMRPSGGEIETFGADPTAVARDRLGVLPQSFSPPGRLTGRELVRYYAGLYGRSRDVSAVLADVGMQDAADRWYERLSGGQQRRICVATALVNDPDLLVLDEPTTGIDPGGRRRLWSLLRELRAAGTTILLTTHDMQEAQAISDRVGLLADGRLAGVGSPDELIEEYAGEGRLVVELTAGQGPPVDPAELPFRATTRNGDLVVRGIDPERISVVVDELADAGTVYDKLAWERPGLEDVFLAMTEDSGEAEG